MKNFTASTMTLHIMHPCSQQFFKSSVCCVEKKAFCTSVNEIGASVGHSCKDLKQLLCSPALSCRMKIHHAPIALLRKILLLENKM